MNAGWFLPVSCESVWSERSRAWNLKIFSLRTSLDQQISMTNLLHGRTHRGQHLQCLPHHVELPGGLGRVVLVVRGQVGGGGVGVRRDGVVVAW